MKLSEAILLGSVNNKQAFGYLKTSDGRTCALGAAYESRGVDLTPLADKNSIFYLKPAAQATLDYLRSNATKWWPLLGELAKNPITGATDQVSTIIVHLNNNLGWSRPRIAEWVATLEAKDEVKVEDGSHCESVCQS